ncbi:MAG: ATP phosphoribosyltransferase, partial [Rhodospirillales bacterium]
SLLIVNRTQMKTRSHLMRGWIERFRSALDAQVA